MIDAGARGQGRQDNLRAWIERFRVEAVYTDAENAEQRAAREDLRSALTLESLSAAIADPSTFLDVFRRINSREYGWAGNQPQINVHLGAGPAAAVALARTIRHLLYGNGDDVERLDDVLDDPEWKVHGFGEALATKYLAIVYPDRWLPLFLYPGENGKEAMMRLPQLPIQPLDKQGKSRAQLAQESNDALRELLKPYFEPDDAWGPVQFLWWLLKSGSSDQDHVTHWCLLANPAIDDVERALAIAPVVTWSVGRLQRVLPKRGDPVLVWRTLAPFSAPVDR